jgi:hypothetical protein
MKWVAAALVSCAMLATPVMAREITPAEQRQHPYDASIPGCDDAVVLGHIASKFSIKEGRFWQSSLTILSFERLQQLAWRPNGLDFIPRRYCSGTVVTSDGIKRRIDYSIREDLGFIGLGFGTEWCVDGLDRNYAYAPQCKQARP